MRSCRLMALMCVLAVAACGEAEEPEPASADTVTAEPLTPPAPAPAAEATPEVAVTLSEWSIDLDRDSIAPGATTFLIRNSGSTEHAFVIRSGEEEWETDPLPPGESVRMSLHLGVGEHAVYCPLQREGVQHADLGMSAVLRVR